jgi:C-terminal processing protease CtpA/Prc
MGSYHRQIRNKLYGNTSSYNSNYSKYIKPTDEPIIDKIEKEVLDTGIIKLTIITSSNLGIKLTLDKDNNASIGTISDNSILQKVGIQLGDIITRINYFRIEELDGTEALADVTRTLNEKKTYSGNNIKSPLQLYIRQTKPTAELYPQTTGGKSRKTKRHRKKSRRSKSRRRNKH